MQDDEKRHQCGQGDAGSEGLERINFGKHLNRLNGRRRPDKKAPQSRGGGKGRSNGKGSPSASGAHRAYKSSPPSRSFFNSSK